MDNGLKHLDAWLTREDDREGGPDSELQDVLREAVARMDLPTRRLIREFAKMLLEFRAAKSDDDPAYGLQMPELAEVNAMAALVAAIEHCLGFAAVGGELTDEALAILAGTKVEG